MADTPDDRVDLTDLDVITRYSLAVRTATADRAELIAALRSDLDWLEGGRARRATARATTATKSAGPRAAAPARSRTARSSAATRKTAAKQTRRGRSTR